MRATTRRLVLIAALIFVVSTVGLVLAVVFQWPTQFDGSGNPNVTAGEVVTGGTATSIPLGPWVALAVFAFLARSQPALVGDPCSNHTLSSWSDLCHRRVG
ncbi:MAG TPA: hypothetical protein VKA51_11840 [Rubrobacteraceae bacterium]|nr:hypothetical protein [Rubrobacteraceae bacterium]